MRCVYPKSEGDKGQAQREEEFINSNVTEAVTNKEDLLMEDVTLKYTWKMSRQLLAKPLEKWPLSNMWKEKDFPIPARG